MYVNVYVYMYVGMYICVWMGETLALAVMLGAN